jgi:hypothetical protein
MNSNPMSATPGNAAPSRRRDSRTRGAVADVVSGRRPGRAPATRARRHQPRQSRHDPRARQRRHDRPHLGRRRGHLCSHRRRPCRRARRRRAARAADHRQGLGAEHARRDVPARRRHRDRAVRRARLSSARAHRRQSRPLAAVHRQALQRGDPSAGQCPGGQPAGARREEGEFRRPRQRHVDHRLADVRQAGHQGRAAPAAPPSRSSRIPTPARPR